MTTDAEVDEICRRAAGAERILADLGRAGRADLLRTMANCLRQDEVALVATAMNETGLTEDRLRGEVARAAGQLDFFARVTEEGAYLNATIDHAGDTSPDLRLVNAPIGPVAVFAASNFPFAFSVPGGDTASALAAGCPVVVKVHPSHPLTSAGCHESLVRACHATGVSQDVVSLVDGFAAGPALVRHPAIAAVGFTGSTAGGSALRLIAESRPHPIPFYGELGSVNAVIVTPKAAAERGPAIGRGLAESVTASNGQLCTKPGLLFVPDSLPGESVLDAFRDALAGAAPQRLLHQGIHQRFRHEISRRRALLGVETLVDASAAGYGELTAGPVLLRADLERLDADLFTECFGPSAVSTTYRGAAELLSALGTLPGALAAAVHGAADEELARSAVRVLERKAGRVVWNGYPTGVAVTWAMHHGGPWPATSDGSSTSVGADAILRFVRPRCYQDVPQELLPAELRDDVQGIVRRVDGRLLTPVVQPDP